MTPLTWQPIASAPMNYDSRLLALASGQVVTGYFSAQYDEWRATFTNSHFGPDLKPTHWMPLPAPPMERPPGADSAEIVSSERSTSDGPRDTALSSSSLRAMYVEEADHLAAIDLTDQIAHLRQQARDAD